MVWPVYIARILVASFVLTFVLGFGYGKVAGVPWQPGEDLASSPNPTSAETTTSSTGAPTTTASTEPPTTTTTEPPTTTTTEPPTTTTTLPKGGRLPTPADPLRVVMAGDSVMAGLWPPVKMALEDGGAAEVRFVLTPSILRDPTIRFTWEQQLEEFKPEVIMMFVGTWESRQVETTAGQKLSIGDPQWRQSYETEVLDPWIHFISEHGAKVVWIGSPVVANDEANLLFYTLNQVFKDLPSRFPQVTYLDSASELQGPTPGFHAIIPSENGTPIRTRQLDGLHLCPDGAALVAKPVLQYFTDTWAVPLAFGWQNMNWRDDARVYPKASCPPA